MRKLFGIVIGLIIGATADITSVSAGQAPIPTLRIQEVFLSFDPDTITIRGQSFNNGSAPTVTLGAAGAITNFCVPNFVAIPQQIVCSGFPSGLPVDGDYSLIVTTGNQPSQTDTFNVTIGAVGPQGPQGPQGRKVFRARPERQALKARGDLKV